MSTVSDQEPNCFGIHIAKWRQYSSDKLIKSQSRQGRQVNHCRSWIQSIVNSLVPDEIAFIDRHNVPAPDGLSDDPQVLFGESGRTIDHNYKQIRVSHCPVSTFD